MTVIKTEVTEPAKYDYSTTVTELREFLGIPDDEVLVQGVFYDGIFIMTTKKKED